MNDVNNQARWLSNWIRSSYWQKSVSRKEIYILAEKSEDDETVQNKYIRRHMDKFLEKAII